MMEPLLLFLTLQGRVTSERDAKLPFVATFFFEKEEQEEEGDRG